MEIVDDQTPRDEMRASDVDRERVAERLRVAHAEGRIDLAEFDERVRQAWAARTYKELDALTADLPATTGAPRRPAPASAPPAPRPGPRPHWEARHGWGQHGAVAAWLSASVINLVIWAVISITTLHWVYPWWLWVAGPWGAILLARYVSGRSAHTE